MSNYIDYMANFSQSDLRGYLGEDMVDLLVEWMPNGDTLLTKQRMVKRLRHFRYLLTTISRTISAIPRNTKIIS